MSTGPEATGSDACTPQVAVLCGGVGAARLLRGMVEVCEASQLVALANVGDDMELHGLHISPDIDTIIYTLAGAVSTERGWGLDGESWQAMEMLGRLGGQNWFSLGDRDLGTHLYRTQRLAEGATLGAVTAELVASWDLPLQLLPVTDDRLRTMVHTDDHGEISFQEYFVGLAHQVAVTRVRFDGSDSCRPGPGVIDALEHASRIVIAPSNPVVSIDPVLAVPGVRDVLRRRRNDVVAVSPIIGGRALKGPADRLLVELGREASAVGVARWYADVVGTMVIDAVDAHLVSEIEAVGLRCVVADTIMDTTERAEAVASACLSPHEFNVGSGGRYS